MPYTISGMGPLLKRTSRLRLAMGILLTLLSFAHQTARGEPATERGFVASVEAVSADEEVASSLGGDLTLLSRATSTCSVAAVIKGGDFSLVKTQTTGCPGCVCGDSVFADGFESGDLDAWDSSVP